MKMHTVSTPKTKEETIFGWKRRVLLIALLTSVVFLFLEAIDRKQTVHLHKTFDVIFFGLWAVLEADAVLHLLGSIKKDGFAQYLKFNKAEILYVVLSPVAQVLSVIHPALSPFRWVIIFKMPNVLRKYNDENVFQVLAKGVALLLIAFFLVPMCNVLAMALSAPGQIINVLPKNIDLFSMKYALQDKMFLSSFANSLFIVLAGTSIFVVITTLAAYPLSKPDMPGRKWFMIFYMITMFFNGGMATDIVLVDSLGLMNTIWALILPNVISVYYMFLIKSYYEGLPVELEEAAKIDGATSIGIFVRIIVPLSKPIIATTASFVVVNLWNNYMSSVMFITSNKLIYPVQMYIRNFLAMDPMDIALDNPKLLSYWDNIEMAYLFLAILPIICAYPILFKFFKGGATAGAVKG
ncbi:MAG: carbohydrate ABC transporter permease [Clostridia bacterium]|nr:carbohydrate ABC transporter permease [Clostridia bacterium]